MRHLAFVLFVTIPSVAAMSQTLRDINYRYRYDAADEFHFEMSVVRGTEWNILYRLEIQDRSVKPEDFVVQWEGRSSLIDDLVTPMEGAQVMENRTHTGFSGVVQLSISAAPPIFVARVIHQEKRQAWLFYQLLPDDWPIDGYLTRGREVVTSGYVNTTDTVVIHGSGPSIISYYSREFPAALPVFSERQGPVPPGLIPDSIFTVSPGEALTFSKKGLYLVQRDTASNQGFAFRVENDYPKLATISSLAGPLIYITTRQEYQRVVQAREEKRVFDRTILGITGDAERARLLIRNYFKRVELANRYFTSYKEGWKTDRGMVFIIYGVPDRVFRFTDREVWEYKNALNELTFNFTRSSTVFDPEYYVLIRDSNWTENWYQMIDLWRNARF